MIIEARGDIAELRIQEQQIEDEKSAQARIDKQDEEQVRQERQQDQEVREQKLAELRQASPRGKQLGEQLLTDENVQRDQNIGSSVDQKI